MDAEGRRTPPGDTRRQQITCVFEWNARVGPGGPINDAVTLDPVSNYSSLLGFRGPQAIRSLPGS